MNRILKTAEVSSQVSEETSLSVKAKKELVKREMVRAIRPYDKRSN